MDTDFSYKDKTEQIIGAAFAVLNETALPVGLILNFKNPKLEVRRVIATTQNFIQREIL